jgi:hypothetical protein
MVLEDGEGSEPGSWRPGTRQGRDRDETLPLPTIENSTMHGPWLAVHKVVCVQGMGDADH